MASRLSSRLSFRSIRSVPAARSISIVSACEQVALCAVFVSSFSSLASLVCVRLRSSPFVIRWRRGVSFLPFVSSLFSSSRLVGRLVGILCGSSLVPSCSSIRLRLAARFARRSATSSRPAACPSVSLVVPRCFALSDLSRPVSCFVSRLAVASRQAVRIFVSLGGSSRRLVGRLGSSLFPVSFFPVLIPLSRSLRLMDMGDGWRAGLALASWRRASFPVSIRHRGEAWRWRDGRAV